MIKKVQERFALTHLGAVNLIKACVSCTISYLAIAMSIGVLYYFTCDVLEMLYGSSNTILYSMYLIEFVIVVILIFIAHYIQYNMTFYNTYKESARLRIRVAEKLRKFPLMFFSKRDLSDLTTTILSDVTGMEQALSHFIPEFFGSIASTLLLSISMFFFDFRMALAAVWCVPVSFLLVVLAKRKLSNAGFKDRQKQLVRTEKIQETLETIRDLKANHYTQQYLNEVDQVIDDCEKSQIKTELTNALFVVSSQLILKLGIATVVIYGVTSLINQMIDLKVFMLFLIVASRLYDPLSGTLQNLAAIISCDPKIARLNEIENYPLQTGEEKFEPSNYDIEFKNVSFEYQSEKKVLEDVSFVAKQNEITALIGNSGGGKTTCASLAARFYELNEGVIKIGGIDISTVDPEILLSKFSIVFQEVVLFNNTILENEKHYYPKKQIEIIKAIKTELSNNISAKYDLEKLVKQYNINIHTFRKAFKEIHGKPIYQWYKEYRLEYSLGLLINTDIPIIEIANEIGYSNPSKYSAAFYQYTSMTPQQYRKSHLKMEQ